VTVETRAYLPGPTLVEIGLAVVQQMDIRVQARPVLEKLAERFGETVHLVTLEGPKVRFVDARREPTCAACGPAHGQHLARALHVRRQGAAGRPER